MPEFNMERNTCGLHLSNPIRRLALFIHQHSAWDRLILFFIFINCLQLMLMSPFAKCCDPTLPFNESTALGRRASLDGCDASYHNYTHLECGRLNVVVHGVVALGPGAETMSYSAKRHQVHDAGVVETPCCLLADAPTTVRVCVCVCASSP